MNRPSRVLLAPAVALLAWALTQPIQAPAPLSASLAPRLSGVQVVRTSGALGASWAPVAGQALVCLVRVEPGPAELIEPCLVGSVGQLTLAGQLDAGLQVAAGDTVDLRAYNARGALLGLARVVVGDRWRTWLPVAGSV